jgi:hypothetical protein
MRPALGIPGKRCRGIERPLHQSWSHRSYFWRSFQPWRRLAVQEAKVDVLGQAAVGLVITLGTRIAAWTVRWRFGILMAFQILCSIRP